MGSMRFRLSGLSGVSIGRGSQRLAERKGSELVVRVPDKWMSTRHAKIEASFGRWVLVDSESKNGSIVDGHTTRRAVLLDGALIELGHTMFAFFEKLPIELEAPATLDVKPDSGPPGMVTLLPAWQHELDRIRAIAGSEIPMLVEGESGSGKEVIARAIHALSGRKGAFVAVNCGALPDNLVESELFGYAKGAFSGAAADHEGLVRSAHRGTLFLDEIGDLPPTSQTALLRVLAEREVMPIGGTRPIPIDLRVIAATHRDLDDMVADQLFRHDLFARLAGFRVVVPTLIERRSDLGLLIGTLHGRLFPEGHPGYAVDAARLLAKYSWPLNVRELEQALATAQVLAGKDVVCAEHLPESVRTGRPPGSPRPVVLSEADQKVKDSLIVALQENSGNVSAVARVLDKDRKQIQRWIKRFGLDPSAYRAGPPPGSDSRA